jgi:hypothetical protein
MKGGKMKFAIWHKDASLTTTPEYVGTEADVIRFWNEKYDGNVGSLSYHIGTPDDRESLYVISRDGDHIEKISMAI